MKRIFLILLFVFTAAISMYAQVVKPEEAAQHIGKRVTVCGEIFNGSFLENAKTSPTLLNMGANYPKQLLTIVIPIEVRRQYGFKPEELLQHKHVCVTGTVTRYQKSLQIIVQDKSQLKIL